MMILAKNIAKTIDHAVLKPNANDGDVREGCRIAEKWSVAAICVRPSDVSLAAGLLKCGSVAVSTVIGFPHGSNRWEVKALEARKAIEDGAVELDMVMNIGRFLSGDYEHVQRDIEAVVAEAVDLNVLVKVIFETCYLTPEQIEKACTIAEASGCDFVKTSTGFGSGSATPEAVEIMVRTVGKTVRVKASGGIRTYDDAVMYIDMGCSRLGTSSTEAILQAAQGSTDDSEY